MPCLYDRQPCIQSDINDIQKKNCKYYKLKRFFLSTRNCVWFVFHTTYKYPAPRFMNKPLTSTSTYRVFVVYTTL